MREPVVSMHSYIEQKRELDEANEEIKILEECYLNIFESRSKARKEIGKLKEEINEIKKKHNLLLTGTTKLSNDKKNLRAENRLLRDSNEHLQELLAQSDLISMKMRIEELEDIVKNALNTLNQFSGFDDKKVTIHRTQTILEDANKS